jgi:aspartyl protease family protein
MKFAAFLIFLALAMAAGSSLFGDQLIFGLSPGAFAAALALAAFAVLNFGWYLTTHRGGLSTTLLQIVAWIGIFAVVMGGYTYRQEFSGVANRMLDELVPGRTIEAAPGEAVAVRRRDGHFAFETVVNGRPLTMMFDTGASSVVLRAEDAVRIGVETGKLNYSIPVSTANGTAMAAPYTIDTITVGKITVRRVRGLVARPGALGESLLGQSFLDRLAGYSVEKNRLVLRGG